MAQIHVDVKKSRFLFLRRLFLHSCLAHSRSHTSTFEANHKPNTPSIHHHEIPFPPRLLGCHYRPSWRKPRMRPQRHRRLRQLQELLFCFRIRIRRLVVRFRNRLPQGLSRTNAPNSEPHGTSRLRFRRRGRCLFFYQGTSQFSGPSRRCYCRPLVRSRCQGTTKRTIIRKLE